MPTHEQYIANINYYKRYTKRLDVKLRASAAGIRYRKTPLGKIKGTYNCMRSRLKNQPRYEGLCICGRDEFIAWSVQDATFSDLYAAWESNNFVFQLSPSIDRIYPNKGYALDNIQWLPLYLNSQKTSKSSTNLTNEVVLEIRDLYAKGIKQVELKAKYNVSKSIIHQIVKRKTWRHL